jgi:hypothetical protein
MFFFIFLLEQAFQNVTESKWGGSEGFFILIHKNVYYIT